MSKAVLMSIKPNWCKLIWSGMKTVEVRKTRPKLKTPFKAYIYCTLTASKEFDLDDHNWDISAKTRGGWPEKRGRVIGDFTCSYIAPIFRSAPWNPGEPAKMYARCADGHCRKGYTDQLLKDACLNKGDIEKYFSGLNGLVGYGWRISALKIYDAPKAIDEFSRFGFFGMGRSNCVCGNWRCENYEPSESYMIPPTCKIDGCSIYRPPQSWCYIEELPNGKERDT